MKFCSGFVTSLFTPLTDFAFKVLMTSPVGVASG